MEKKKKKNFVLLVRRAKEGFCVLPPSTDIGQTLFMCPVWPRRTHQQQDRSEIQMESRVDGCWQGPSLYTSFIKFRPRDAAGLPGPFQIVILAKKKQQHTPGIQSPFSLPEWSFAYRQVAGKRKKVEERKMMKNWTGRYRADKKTTPRHANWIIIRLFSSPTAKRSVQTNQVTRRCGSHAVPADGKKKHKKCAHIYRKDVFTLDAG